MLKKIFFIFFIILFASDALAQRLLLGMSTTDLNFEKEDDTSPNQYYYKTDERYRNQGFENLYYNYSPYTSFETRPFYLFKNVSLDFGVEFERNNKRTLKGFPENTDNSSSELSIDLIMDYNIIYSGFYFVFGDKELGKNGGLSATLGFKFTKQELVYKYEFLGKSYQESEIQDSGGFILRFDYGNVNLSIYDRGGGGGLNFDELEQPYKSNLGITLTRFVLSYSLYL